MKQPLVVVSCDRIEHNHMAWSATPATYLEALALVGIVPVQLPTLPAAVDAAPLLDAANGVLLTGARSNVQPSLYGAADVEAAGPYDPARDRTTMALIRGALERRLPLLAICRGIQELNVALGGTLHHALHDVPGRADHRSPPNPDLDVRFAIRHPVSLTPGGRLAAALGPGPIRVNSVHQQAIDRLADGLTAEAVAEDGTIEAVSVSGHPFAVGVQWHPEHFVASDGPSRGVFDAFAAAVKAGAREARVAA